jgi:mercuric ion transport protein
MKVLDHKKTLLVGVAAALGASVCCVLPLVLVMLGLGGAWVSSLSAMAPYRPFFVGLALLFLGVAFYQLYLQKPKACAPGEVCAVEPGLKQRQRLIFWIVASLTLTLLAIPWVLPLFY